MDTVDEIVGFEEPGDEVDRVAYAVIGAAIEVHKELGPGHLESFYEEALCVELGLRGMRYQRQAPVAMSDKGHPIGSGRIDLIVEDLLIVEIKACEDLAPIHTAQLIAYLKITHKKLGLLINFNVPHLRQGIRRIINGPESEL